MFAGKITGPHRIELVDAPPLAPLLPGEITFAPRTTCLCGSDLPYFQMAEEVTRLEDTPRIGQSLHEMVGDVVESRSERFRPGQKVLAVPEDHLGFFEQWNVHESRVFPLDPRVSAEAALMAQPLGTVVHAMRKLPPVLGKRVVIVGQGPMGQLFNAAMKSLGAIEVIGIDPLESRLKLSPQMGTTHAICNATIDAESAVREILPGGADIVVECVGHADQAINLCIDLCAEDGVILFFGVPPHEIDGVPFRKLFWSNQHIVTSVVPDFPIDFPAAMNWIGNGSIDPLPLITHRFPVAEIQSAFETFHNRTHGAQKVIVEFP